MRFAINFTDEGENILRKLAKDERMINYNDLFFKTGDPNINNLDFLKWFGTLYDLLLDLLNEKISTKKAAKEQSEMKYRLEELKGFILLEKESIKKEMTRGAIKKTETKAQGKEDIASQKSVLKTIMINALIKKNICSGDVEKDAYYFDETFEPKFEESILERTKVGRHNEEGQGLKTLTTEQMLSRLPSTVTQFKARNSSEKLKNEGNYCILFIVQRNYPKQSINIWPLLSKNGNNIYEYSK